MKLPPMPPEVMRALDQIAAAKMHLLLAASSPARSVERTRELDGLERTIKAAHEYIASHIAGGLEKLPHVLRVQLRACELGLEKLRP